MYLNGRSRDRVGAGEIPPRGFINTLQCPLLKQGESPPMQMHPGAERGDTGEIEQQEKQLGRTLIAAGRERPRPVSLCPSEYSGHVRKNAGYAENAVGGTGAPGKDLYLRRRARS